MCYIDILGVFRRVLGALQSVFSCISGNFRRFSASFRNVFGGFGESEVCYSVPRGFSVAFHEVSKDFQWVSEALEGRFWVLRRVSGTSVRGGFRGFVVAFRKFQRIFRVVTGSFVGF